MFSIEFSNNKIERFFNVALQKYVIQVLSEKVSGNWMNIVALGKYQKLTEFTSKHFVDQVESFEKLNKENEEWEDRQKYAEEQFFKLVLADMQFEMGEEDAEKFIKNNANYFLSDLWYKKFYQFALRSSQE